MSTLENRLIALAQAIGADIKIMKIAEGDLSALSTTAKTNLVAAINEIFTLAQSGVSLINDTTASVSKTYSSAKIGTQLTSAIDALRTELKAGAGAALDTFAELAAALNNDPSFATTVATSLSKRLRFDAAQTLTLAEKLQARQNIDALGSVELGNPDADLVATYTTAKT
ncbi:MAG: hypothetical protein K2P84_00020 [Undibacterium sp.]|nr:hypothetical protein [Undibacterium sp.]